MSCTTKDNFLIFFEMTLLKKDYIYSEIKYKSETNEKEIQFENFLMLILSYFENEINDDFVCR